MKILIVTDAWHPQVNGVVNTYSNIANYIDCSFIHPYSLPFKRLAIPSYKEIEIVVNPYIIKPLILEAIKDNTHIHIATEGPLGCYTRLLIKHYPFTTCYHTKFPEFLKKQLNIPLFMTKWFFKWFHSKSKCCMIPTNEMLKELNWHNTKVWGRGVDHTLFNTQQYKKPKQHYIVCVSRISKEKNLDDFCKLKYNKKILVGDGPYLQTLKSKYKDVEFVGMKKGKELAELYASSDAFIFPSKEDTYGIVLLEALASGTPIISYPSPGAKQCIINELNGFITNDLQQAVNNIDMIERNQVAKSSKQYTWQHSADEFLSNILNT